MERFPNSKIEKREDEVKKEIKEEPTIDEKIEQKKKELEEAQEKAAIYRPIGWFQKKPVVKDLGYYASEAETREKKDELGELLDEKIEEQEKKTKEKEEKHGAIYGPIGPFYRKPVVKDLGYYASEAEVGGAKKELKDIKKEKKQILKGKGKKEEAEKVQEIAKPETTEKKETKKEAKKEEEKETKYSHMEELINHWIERKIQKEKEKLRRETGSADRNKAEDNLRDRFKKIFPRVFRSFAVHGRVSYEGGRKIYEDSDLDAKVCLGLVNLVGWETKTKGKDKNVSYIDFDKRLKGTVHLDVGQYSGITFLQETSKGLETLELSNKRKLEERKTDKNFFFNLGVIIDHHPEGASSASMMVFKLLDKLGMFENNKDIKRGDIRTAKQLVRFVDIVDSRGFQEIGKPQNWNKSDRTILGLYRFMGLNNLWKFFQEDGDFYRPLNNYELRKYGLIYADNKKRKTVNKQELQRKIIDSSNKKLKELGKGKFIINTKFGKMVIDAKRELAGGAMAAQSIGAGYLKWDAENKTFFMFSDKILDQDLFKTGVRIRKHLWVTTPSKASELTLGKIIKRIGGQIEPKGELEKYLKQEEGKKKPTRKKTTIKRTR